MDRDTSHLRGKEAGLGGATPATAQSLSRKEAQLQSALLTSILLTSLRAHLNKEKISPEQSF